MSRFTRRNMLAGAAASGALAAPAIARAAENLRWRMVTSWPRNLPGPGVSARRLAERIGAMSSDRLRIELHAAGELVPALEVFDAVAGGVAEMAHTASFFWQGKLPGATFFTTVPFGLGPIEHLAWIELAGGQKLWDELYAPSGLKGFLAGNTGPSMGGWFRREVTTLDDLKGLRIRVQGLGGEVFRRLGATPVSVPPGEIPTSLATGTIDAAEFLAPSSDLATGLQRATTNYYAPGFNKPNGAGEALVSLAAWNRLPEDLKAIVAEACRVEHAAGLADAERLNAPALEALTGRHGVRILQFPDVVLDAARAAADAALRDLAARDAMTARIADSYRATLESGAAWSRVTSQMARRIRGG